MTTKVLSQSYAFWNDKKIKGLVSLKNKAKYERVVIVLYFHRLWISVSRKSQFCSLVMRKLDCLEKMKERFSLLRNCSQNMKYIRLHFFLLVMVNFHITAIYTSTYGIKTPHFKV